MQDIGSLQYVVSYVPSYPALYLCLHFLAHNINSCWGRTGRKRDSNGGDAVLNKADTQSVCKSSVSSIEESESESEVASRMKVESWLQDAKQLELQESGSAPLSGGESFNHS